jgi:integral membrane protein (TIGR01906 family)
MKLKKWSVYLIVGILLVITTLLTSVEIIAFNVNYYRNSFEKNNISEITGIDQENLEYVIKDMLKYLKNDKKSLDTKAVVNGEEREVYNEREKLHMVDVKQLFVEGVILRNFSFYLLLALILILIKKDKLWKINISKTLLYTGIVNNLILALFLLLISIDFNKYFTYFHLIFFNNDLWILNPKTDILIQLVPEQFFFDTASKIIIVFAGTLTLLAVIGFIILKMQSKRKSIVRELTNKV